MLDQTYTLVGLVFRWLVSGLPTPDGSLRRCPNISVLPRCRARGSSSPTTSCSPTSIMTGLGRQGPKTSPGQLFRRTQNLARSGQAARPVSVRSFSLLRAWTTSRLSWAPCSPASSRYRSAAVCRLATTSQRRHRRHCTGRGAHDVRQLGDRPRYVGRASEAENAAVIEVDSLDLDARGGGGCGSTGCPRSPTCSTPLGRPEPRPV